MRRITESDASLAEKLLNRIKSLKNAFAGSKDPSVRAQSTRLSKVEKLWLRAVDDAGYKYGSDPINCNLESGKVQSSFGTSA